ncbi:hypothetical protein [Asticcacaulis solisilvae]|uniref:hypothetical protein n=1 Tax=Asticcacaulis solisilvae TaxID=1217274 RepID=UPI003FD80154
MKISSTIAAAVAAAIIAGTCQAAETETGSGPFSAVYEEDPTLPAHVIYHPQAMGQAKLPVYVFGNGGCSADGTSSRNHLLDIASHGYLIVAPGVIAALHPEAAKPTEGPGLGMATRASALTEAIDWAVRENDRPQSPYFHKIDTHAIAVSGWSCGGLQAIIVAPDPRVKTLVVMNSGVFNGDKNLIPGMEVHKAMLADIHVPTLYILGGPSDIAYANGMDDYARLTTVPAALVNIPVGHGGTYMQPHGGIAAEVVVDWLDWQLKGDREKGKMFFGTACGFCGDSRLTLESKNMPSH